MACAKEEFYELTGWVFIKEMLKKDPGSAGEIDENYEGLESIAG